jgi:hypothetical protein
LERAKKRADKIAYSQMHLVFELIASMTEEKPDKTTLKNGKTKSK